MTDRAKDRLGEIAEEFHQEHTYIDLDLDTLRMILMPTLQQAYALGRADENDEASGIAEKRCQCPHHISIAYEIRSRMSGTGEGK